MRPHWAYRAVDASTAVVVLAELLGLMIILAGAVNTISSECRRKVGPVVPPQLVLLQARESSVHHSVIKGGAENERCPIADGLASRAPCASLALWNALFVDVIMRRCRLVVPEVVGALVWIRQLASFARLDCQWDRL